MAEMMTSPELELAPEPPPHGPVVWLRNNMFQSVVSGIMSVSAILVVIFSVRGLLGWTFDPFRRWDAITYNMKLLMVLAYPGEHLWRVWLSIGIVVVLLAASLAIWKIGGKAEPRHVGRTLMSIGGGIVFFAVLSPWSMSARVSTIVVGVILLAIGWALRTMLGERAKEPIVPVLGLVAIALGVVLVAIWTINVPWPAKIDGNQTIVYEPIAASTTIPWTIMYFLGIAVYLLTRALGERMHAQRVRSSVIGLWVLSFPVIVLVILRNPQLDMGRGLTVFLPILAVFAIGGSALLMVVDKLGKSELARIIGAGLLVISFVSFAFPMLFIIRFLLLALAIFALMAPTFGGEGDTQRRFLAAWVITASVIVLTTWVSLNVSGISVPSESFLGGLMLTIVLAITSIVLSFPIGVLMALGRTSSMPIFRLMSTAYIELVRGVPLITWLLVAFIMLPVAIPENIHLTGVMKAIGAMTFFSAAYLAENVRGGLQSISRGQKEASRALGMTTLQETVFIILPQALRAVIPALVGQVIALFKDTSLVTIVSLFDFLHIARTVIPAQSQPFLFKGTITQTLLFASVVYWMFTFTFSRISLRLEKKLGVGER